MKRMLRKIGWLVGMLSLLLMVGVAAAGVDRFVIKDHPNGDGEYLKWETAAPDIQSAIDAAGAGDTIWVTNGVYDTGGRTVGANWTTNRVVIDKEVTVRSVNGPNYTFIEGSKDFNDADGQVEGLGTNSVRGVHMGPGSALMGFTVTNGATVFWSPGSQAGLRDIRGGGILAQNGSVPIVISNCVVVGNSSTRRGAGISIDGPATVYDTIVSHNRVVDYGSAGIEASAEALFYRCVITHNYNHSNVGGGVQGGVYHDCLIAHNEAGSSAGGTSAVFHDCVISNNVTWGNVGGIGSSTAYDTLIVANSAGSGAANNSGGGASGSILHRCEVIGNYVNGDGGGAINSTLYDCLVKGNTAQRRGGGVDNCTVYNSRIIGNDVPNWQGGGARNSTLYNSLLVGNQSTWDGGGTVESDLYNCTVVGNKVTGSGYEGGGVHGGLVINSIVVGNQAPDGVNYAGTVVFTNSLTYPEQVGWAVGNITNAPIFFEAGSGYGLDHVPGDYQLQSHSPGMNAGIEFDWMTEPQFEGDIRYLDLEGNPRIGKAGVVDMGAYEFVYILGTIIMMR